MKLRRVSASKSAPAAANVRPSLPQLRANFDQTHVIPEHEPSVDQACSTKTSRKSPLAASNYSVGDERLPTPVSPSTDEFSSDGHHDADEDSVEYNENYTEFMPDESAFPGKSSS